MTTSGALSTLKASQLKYAATSIGLASTGTKAELENLIRQRVGEQWLSTKSPRIVSIDMGIKNLGICVLEAPGFDRSKEIRSSIDSRMPIKVLEWKKVDVLSQLSSATDVVSPAKSERQRAAKPAIDASIFRPSVLSRTALNIAEDLLHSYKPSHILIERQRFRSGGASAVQEWTLRVNMLESMLWACFATIQSTRSRKHISSNFSTTFPEIFEVSPARVARFWCGSPLERGTVITAALLAGEVKIVASPQHERKKIDKKDKINVVRSWLAVDGKHPDVQLEFTSQAQKIAEAFKTEAGRERRRGGSALSTGVHEPPKLDDLADCLLQGVAWVRWEENRQRLASILEASD